jgi:putative phosphonate metabolism protein
MRHAIYYTPDPAGSLRQLGSSWLGRDSHTNVLIQQPDSRLLGFTLNAARYGFHGTLKPPFYMKERVSIEVFETALKTLANQHESFSAGPIELRMIDGFLALVLAKESLALSQLASDCVQQLDNYRSPPSEAELLKRKSAGLTPAQDALLQRWGYPYVFEEFRFHITLTSKLDAPDAEWIYALAQLHFATVLNRPLQIDALTLMIEPADGEDFIVRDRVPLIYNTLKVA